MILFDVLLYYLCCCCLFGLFVVVCMLTVYFFVFLFACAGYFSFLLVSVVWDMMVVALRSIFDVYLLIIVLLI